MPEMNSPEMVELMLWQMVRMMLMFCSLLFLGVLAVAMLEHIIVRLTAGESPNREKGELQGGGGESSS